MILSPSTDKHYLLDSEDDFVQVVEKGLGCSSEILEKTPKRYQDPVLWAWLEMFFTPER